MNPDTGDLIRLRKGEEPPDGFEELPPELNHAANCKLAGRDRATVSLTSGGKLSKWAAKERAKRKKRRKVANASKRRNRNKR